MDVDGCLSCHTYVVMTSRR